MDPTFLIGLIVVLSIVWLFTLIHHIGRTDLSDSDRIVWTIVLCTLNVLGVVLYVLYASENKSIKPRKKSLVESEAELKERFNRGG